MHLKLSDRLQMIADHVENGETIADIGTDHGYIPIWLRQENICSKVILSDVNEGPLKKASENIEKYLPGASLDLRLGSGIRTLGTAEADTVIIAGMGGLLIKDILTDNYQLTASIKKFILQPRNNAYQLRKWLHTLPEFYIADEQIVREVDKFSEIITVKLKSSITSEDLIRAEKTENYIKNSGIDEDFFYIIPAVYFTHADKTLTEYLEKRAEVESYIIKSISENGHTEDAESKKKMAALRISYIRSMIQSLGGNAYND